MGNKTEKLTFTIFPSCKYHKKQAPRVFVTEAELKGAGPGWADSPAFLDMPDAVDEKPADETTETPAAETTETPEENAPEDATAKPSYRRKR